MKLRGKISLLIVLVLLAQCFCLAPALAEEYETLRPGMRGEAVKKMQQALIDQGYLGGTADGIYGTNTENAVRKFQRAHHLKVDGIAGKATLTLLYGSASDGSSDSSGSPTSSGDAAELTFSGNYATLRRGDRGTRVVLLQKMLKKLGYLGGSADGKFGTLTRKAVIAFQKKQKLTADGVAGKKTLKALEKAVKAAGSSSGGNSSSSGSSDTPSQDGNSSGDETSTPTSGGPSVSSIKLLSWFDDIKPNLKSGDHLLIFEPVSGLSWTLRVYSRGNHCDAEPLTKADTETMVKAFGGVNTWNQKGVYVRLPSGVWTIGSTHDMPHMSGSISNNGFSGHLCVHFLRTMAECRQHDPKYGVANQETIRELWKKLTGQVIDY